MPPQVLSAAVVLQSLFGVSDFDAVRELRCDLRWKAACGLGLHDTAFDPSLLTYFRRRLQRSADPNRIFTKVKEVVAATGALKGKHRRAPPTPLSLRSASTARPGRPGAGPSIRTMSSPELPGTRRSGRNLTGSATRTSRRRSPSTHTR
ncbi:transposase [Kitasatospora sp. GP82]|uniref:transposase n=1 Tax=Kitasatospora sp. GP82 TaxID=3035089 RepID=UPI002475F501|nr:transposase [Kitasatospora sp. GP82]